MATLNARSSRRRRSINEINMVPFIDVMLVLLIIFMVSAPLITSGVVDLPSIGHAGQGDQHAIEVRLLKNGRYGLKLDSKSVDEVDLAELAGRVASLQQGANDAKGNPPAVVISAAKDRSYDDVMKVMDELQRAEISKVGLLVQPSGH